MNSQDDNPRQTQRAPGSLGLIRLFGIPVRFHFTFWLVAVWLIYIGVTARQSIAGSTLYVYLFLSVLFHEAGHALAARHYGIQTLEIVMLPWAVSRAWSGSRCPPRSSGWRSPARW